MELSLTTFILETVNFLALVWILKRLFFAPIKRVIEARKDAVAKSLKDAEATKTEASKLQTQYESRLSAWETEKTKAREELERALAEERAKRLKQIEASVEVERQKMRAQEETKAAEERKRQEQEAMTQSLSFVSRLLSAVSSPELEAALIKLALGRLDKMSGVPTEKNSYPSVRTAFGLSEAQKQAIRHSIGLRSGSHTDVPFSTDSTLISGIEIVLGSTVVRANLRDELSFFARGGQ